MIDYSEVCYFAKSIEHEDILYYATINGVKYSMHLHKFSCAPSIIDIRTFILLWQREPKMIHTIYAKKPNVLCVYTLQSKLPQENMLLPALKEWFDNNIKKEVFKCTV